MFLGHEVLFVFGCESDAICTPYLTNFVPMPELNIEIIGLDFIFDWRGFCQADWQESCCCQTAWRLIYVVAVVSGRTGTE